jgi:hypothetical protein
MHLKSKLISIACAAFLAAGAGALLAGPAQANSGNKMCIQTSPTGYCMYHSGSSVFMDTGEGDNFNSPQSAQGQISVNGSNPAECLTVGGGKTVILEECSGAATQEWLPILENSESGAYAYYNADTGDCLHVATNDTTVNVYNCALNAHNLWYLDGA